MSERVVQASTFKATCLALLDDVAANQTSVLVTKHGKPVARLIPVDRPAPTMGSVTLLSHDEDDYMSTRERWTADPA